MDLKGRTAIVTGAGKGIGRAIATALAQEGVSVGLIARTTADLEALAAELSESYDVRVSVAAADIANRAEVEAAVARLVGDLGSVGILVNNAGTAKFGTILEMDPADWERIIQVNLLGTYYVTRAVLPLMMERKGGDIINISSTAGERGNATVSAYAASKAGLIAFNESLMLEARKYDIRVILLNPSTVNTELAARVGLKIGEEDRMLQPEDVAELTLAALKLPQRALVRNLALLTTNPQ